MPDLTHVAVVGLLGQFDHEVNFPIAWDFVIVHGPNGVGKTKLLELILATSAGSVPDLLRIPFSTARLDFDDKSSLLVSKNGQMILTDTNADELDEADATITFRLQSPGREPHLWTSGTLSPALSSRLLRYIGEIPYLSRVGTRVWHDQRTRRRLTLDEVLQANPRIARLMDVEHEAPDEILQNFLRTFRVHLIETQRLLSVDRADNRSARDGHTQVSTVSDYSDDVVKRLREALAQNSRTSQELDSSFPRRLLSNTPLPLEVTDDVIRERYEQQNALRNRLSEISVLDTTQEVPLPSRNLHTWEQRVLWTYLEDSASKLSTFNVLLDKIQLLRQIVNGRFLHKKIVINQDVGFAFRTSAGHDIGPEKLSSGEQHELVLIYELLFKVQPGSLVLIDEPEISLHIGWQQRFLDDIAQVAELASLRFVVATHSPQIVHKWWDRAVALAPDEGDYWRAIEGA